jgi:hypothetical protein
MRKVERKIRFDPELFKTYMNLQKRLNPDTISKSSRIREGPYVSASSIRLALRTGRMTERIFNRLHVIMGKSRGELGKIIGARMG